jgi:serine/threonine protein kinase
MKETNSFPYETVGKLGMGMFGEVSLVKHTQTGEQFAMKCIKEETIQRHPKMLLMIEHEIAGLKGVVHQNVVRFIDGFKFRNDYFLFYEVCESESLKSRLKNKGPWEEDRILELAISMVNALVFLHDRKIVHRDIKPDNILMKDGYFKLADFGLCFRGGPHYDKDTIGSLAYVAPEILRMKYYSEKSDIYALGIGLFEMANGRYPFDTKNERLLLKRKLEWYPTRSQLPGKSDFLVKLLTEMVEPNHEHRPTAKELLMKLTSAPLQNSWASEDRQKDSPQNSWSPQHSHVSQRISPQTLQPTPVDPSPSPYHQPDPFHPTHLNQPPTQTQPTSFEPSPYSYSITPSNDFTPRYQPAIRLNRGASIPRQAFHIKPVQPDHQQPNFFMARQVSHQQMPQRTQQLNQTEAIRAPVNEGYDRQNEYGRLPGQEEAQRHVMYPMNYQESYQPLQNEGLLTPLSFVNSVQSVPKKLFRNHQIRSRITDKSIEAYPGHPDPFAQTPTARPQPLRSPSPQPPFPPAQTPQNHFGANSPKSYSFVDPSLPPRPSNISVRGLPQPPPQPVETPNPVPHMDPNDSHAQDQTQEAKLDSRPRYQLESSSFRSRTPLITTEQAREPKDRSRVMIFEEQPQPKAVHVDLDVSPKRYSKYLNSRQTNLQQEQEQARRAEEQETQTAFSSRINQRLFDIGNHGSNLAAKRMSAKKQNNEAELMNRSRPDDSFSRGQRSHYGNTFQPLEKAPPPTETPLYPKVDSFGSRLRTAGKIQIFDDVQPNANRDEAIRPRQMGEQKNSFYKDYSQSYY